MPSNSCMVCLPMSEPSRGPAALAQFISSRIDPEGRWSLTSDEAIARLGLDPVDFWRAAHLLRNRVGFLDAVDGFTQDTVGDLVTITETVFGSEAEEALSRAGAFIAHPQRLELMEGLFSRAEGFAEAHQIIDEELASMIRFGGSIGMALPIYFDEHADLSRFIEETAEAFAESRGMPEPGIFTAARFLRELFSRHIVDRQALFTGLERRLRAAARRLGFAEPWQDEQDDERTRTGQAGGGGGRGRLSWARKVLDLPPVPVAFETLRRRYRELIMRYHPDVNPSGLERCKDITAAYSVLASRAQEGEMI
jgi:hypothetical protein